MIRTKPALDPKRPEDGARILIEQTWPRSMPKGKASGRIEWMKQLYPSQNLQDWMRRNPRKAESFRERYLVELARNESSVGKVCALHKQYGDVTILTFPVPGPWDIYETLASYLQAVCE